MANSTLSPPQSPVSSTPSSQRPVPANRAYTAPDKMSVNGHFASVGQNGTANFDNGVQVVDEDKDFKYVSCTQSSATVAKPLLTIYLQPRPGKIPAAHRRLACGIQLPSDLRFRFAIDRKVYSSKRTLQHRVQRYVGGRKASNHKGNLVVKEQIIFCSHG